MKVTNIKGEIPPLESDGGAFGEFFFKYKIIWLHAENNGQVKRKHAIHEIIHYLHLARDGEDLINYTKQEHEDEEARTIKETDIWLRS